MKGDYHGKGAISTLRFIAWLNLICGCIGSLIIYIGWGTVFVSSPTYDFISHYETNPVAIALSLALLIEGIVGCAFFLVICSMAENLIAIRENTEAKYSTTTKQEDFNITKELKDEDDFCYHCGAANPKRLKYCPECGKKL